MTHRTHVFPDGSSVRANEENLQRFLDIKQGMASKKLSWKEGLEAMGVKAIHPDDGWVTRYLKPGTKPSGLQNYTKDGEFESIHWAYPDLRLDLEPGDLIALGWPSYSDDDPLARTRLVLFTHTTPYQIQFPEREAWRWHFVNVIRVPAFKRGLIPRYRADVIIDKSDTVLVDRREPGADPRPATPNEIVAARDLTILARENLREIEGLFKGIFQ